MIKPHAKTRIDLLHESLNAIRAENPRFWTDDELADQLDSHGSILEKTIDEKRFGEITVRRYVLCDLLPDCESGFDGRFRNVEITTGAFGGPYQHQSIDNRSFESVCDLQRLVSYLSDCIAWLKESP